MLKQWVIQKASPDDGDAVDWDCFQLGTVSEGYFMTIATFYDEAEALRFRSAIQWLESLEEYNLSMQPPAAIKPKVIPRKRSKNAQA